MAFGCVAQGILNNDPAERPDHKQAPAGHAQGSLANCFGILHHKILSPRMMHHNRRRALLRLQQETRSQTHAHVLLRLEQREELCLVLQVRTRRIAERIPRPAILLMKEIADVRRVFGCDS